MNVQYNTKLYSVIPNVDTPFMDFFKPLKMAHQDRQRVSIVFIVGKFHCSTQEYVITTISSFTMMM